MSELEDTADHLIVIGSGRLLADVSVGELLAKATNGRVDLRTPDLPAAMTVLANAGATPVSSGPDRISVSGIAPATVAELLVENRVRLEELAPARVTLEEAYFSLTRDTAAFTAERATA